MSKIIEVSKKGKQALSVSIRKWERVVKAWEDCGPDGDIDPNKDGIGSDGCGLCTQYRRDVWRVTCEGCPIALDTGEIGCIKTPYGLYEEGAISTWRERRKSLITCVTLIPAVSWCRGCVITG